MAMVHSVARRKRGATTHVDGHRIVRRVTAATACQALFVRASRIGSTGSVPSTFRSLIT